MRESKVEEDTVEYAKDYGVDHLKLNGIGSRGKTDQMFFRKGVVGFLEIKAPGKKPKDKEVKMLSAIVLSAMEGAFQLSATAGGVMPKGYAAEGIIGLIDGKIN